MNSLISLAEQQFLGDFALSECERKFLEKIDTNQILKCQEYNNKSKYFSSQAKYNQIRAKLIIWLCTDSNALQFIVKCGLKISDVKITGQLDLRFLTLDFPIIFNKCIFTKAICLQGTNLKLLDLSDSVVHSSYILDEYVNENKLFSLKANNVNVCGNILLTNFKAFERVSFSDAKIDGNIISRKAEFDSTDNLALDFTNAKINGSIILTNKFKANGLVSLYGAEIKNLECDGVFKATSSNEQLSLIGDNAQINGSVFLKKNFKSSGKVSFSRAKMLSLECEGAIIETGSNLALIVDNSLINGYVLLRDGFKANGRVSLSGTQMNSLDCRNGHFISSSEKLALIVENSQINGCVLLTEGFKANGEVSLFGSSIGSLKCDGGEFNNPENTAINLQNCKINGPVSLQTILTEYKFKANGEVSLLGSSIGSLECDGGEFNNPENTALNAEDTQINGSVLLREGFKANGEVSFLNSTINNVDCNGEFKNSKDKDFALNFQGSRIKGSVLLREGFKGIGIVSFRDTNIEDTLGFFFDNSSLKQTNSLNHYILDLEFAKVNTLEDEEKSWPQKDNLQLDGFSYEKISINSPSDSEKRLKWLRLQKNKPFSPQPYEKLAKILKVSGKEKTATEILIGKQNDRLHYAELNLPYKCWSMFLGFTIDYGYRPYKALCFSALIISLGTIFFSCGYSGLNCENSTNERLMIQTRVKQFELSSELVVSLPSQSSMISENYPTFNPLFYSLDVFLPIVDLSQQNYWLPSSNRGKNIKFLNIQTGVLLHWYYWFHIIAGWFLTTLFVTAFTGLIKNLN